MLVHPCAKFTQFLMDLYEIVWYVGDCSGFHRSTEVPESQLVPWGGAGRLSRSPSIPGHSWPNT